MVRNEMDGSLVFRLYRPGASRVEVVREIAGSHQRMCMRRERGGHWVLTLDPGPGEHLYRFLVDETRWLLDAAAGGCCLAADGRAWSRVSCGERSATAA